MIVGKGRTGKTTLYMAMKGEEFKIPESTVVADVTVQDVSADATTTTFKKAKSGGNLVRMLARSMNSADEHSAARAEDVQRHPDLDWEVIYKETEESSDNPESMRVSVWDFGGQEVFYTSHVMFLNRNCLYMVVFSVEEFLGRESNGNGNTADKQRKDAKEFLRIWLQNIRTFADGAPIIFVGTKIDKLEEYNDPEALLEVLLDVNDQIMDIAEKIYKDVPWSLCTQWSPDGSNLEPEDLIFFPANSKYRSIGGEVYGTVIKLRRQVVEIFKKDKKANEEVPAAWAKVCDDLIAKNQEIFTFEAIKEECRKHKIVDEREVRLMLQKYHDLGLAMYFDEDELRDYIVWQPQHLIDLVKKLIFDRRLHRRARNQLAGEHRGKMKMYLDTGVIHEGVLRHLWQQIPKDDTEDSKSTANGLEGKKKLYEFGRNMLQK